jgi:hypothetical protein
MRPRHRLGLGAALTVERRPDASEGEQRPVVVEREPHLVLLSLARTDSRVVALYAMQGLLGDVVLSE